MTTSQPQLTQLLKDWGNGDPATHDVLMSAVYEELHRLAHQYMRQERPGHTLQTSALVNEAFVKLVDLEMLQMSTLELSELIQQQLTENPVLEEVATQEEAR